MNDRTLERAARAAALFSPTQLTLARQASGLTKSLLAEAVQVTPTAIAQFEKGETKPTARVLALLAGQLGYDPAFLSKEAPVFDDGSAPWPFFRSLRKTAQRDRDKATAMARLVYRYSQALEEYLELPALRLPEHRIGLDASRSVVEGIARKVRGLWGLGDDPIPNLVTQLERNGILVVRHKFFVDDLQAFSSRFPTRPLVVLGEYANDAARSRFDAAHELGHLVMHDDDGTISKAVEDQAHLFASSLLVPTDRFVDDFPRRLTWDSLAAMKHKWGVSIAAILYRSKQLGLLPEHAYKRIIMQMATLNIKKPEAYPLPAIERPSLIANATRALEHDGIAEGLMDAVGLPGELRGSVTLSDTRLRQRVDGF